MDILSIDNDIRYSSAENKYLPYVVNLKLLEMKSKVILKINYKAIQIIDKLFMIKVFDIKEIYAFDIQNENVTWKRYIDKEISDDLEIGYMTDYQKLMENTALWFYDIKHIVRKGTTLSQFFKEIKGINYKKRKKCKWIYKKTSIYI